MANGNVMNGRKEKKMYYKAWFKDKSGKTFTKEFSTYEKMIGFINKVHEEGTKITYFITIG